MLLSQNTTQSRTQEGKNGECVKWDLKFEISDFKSRTTMPAQYKEQKGANPEQKVMAKQCERREGAEGPN
jgi:hypothetical protein